MPEFYRKCYVTYVLIALNVLLFVAETACGGSENAYVAANFGALYTPYVLEGHEYWRIVTSMFLHFGYSHLFSNMLAIFALGPYIEVIFGKVNFVLIYMVAGICGNLLSVARDAFFGQVVLSAGASGAIFGLFGAIAMLITIPRFRRIFPVKNVALALIINLSYGLSEPGINMYAHAGGLVGGFVLAAVIVELKKRKNGVS